MLLLSYFSWAKADKRVLQHLSLCRWYFSKVCPCFQSLPYFCSLLSWMKLSFPYISSVYLLSLFFLIWLWKVMYGVCPSTSPSPYLSGCVIKFPVLKYQIPNIYWLVFAQISRYANLPDGRRQFCSTVIIQNTGLNFWN